MSNLEIIIVLKGVEEELKSLLEIIQQTKQISDWSFALEEDGEVFLLMWWKWCADNSLDCLGVLQALSINFKTLQIKVEMLDPIKKYIAVHNISNGFIETFSCIYNSLSILDAFVLTHNITEVTCN